MSMQPFIPHGQINIYRFVPLDETYQNTLHFPNRAAQLSYFGCVDNDTPVAPVADTIMKLRYTGQTFTRNERQYIRIEANATMIYDCNYMAYQNRQFGSMWFFAFIHSVEYLGNNVCEVYFEIDVMQSFMWNYELRECFVLREHDCQNGSQPDKIGDNLQAEALSNFTYKTSNFAKTNWFEEFSILALTAFSTHPFGSSSYFEFKKISGMPMAGDITTFASDDYENIAEQIRVWVSGGALEGIVSLTLFPSMFATSLENEKTRTFTENRPADVDGYIPVNNKLFTYPYTFLIVDCGNNSATYRYEFFDENQAILFSCTGCEGALPQIRITPLNYNNAIREGTDTLIMTNFPQLFMAGNNFANWIGQNGTSVLFQGAIDLATLAIGAASGTPTAITSGATGLAKEITGLLHATNLPATAKTTGSSNSAFVTGDMNIYFKRTQINAEAARVADDYFTQYGYATNKVKIPNIRWYDRCRPDFNYLQCREMSFHWEEYKDPQGEGKGTSVPQKYMKKIVEIYQKGITFWKNPEKVGRYGELKYHNNYKSNPSGYDPSA